MVIFMVIFMVIDYGPLWEKRTSFLSQISTTKTAKSIIDIFLCCYHVGLVTQIQSSFDDITKVLHILNGTFENWVR